MQAPNYRFYATLLDAFKWYERSESENAEQEFLNSINRVPVEDEEALLRMNRGRVMNELVDAQIGQPPLTGETVEREGHTFQAHIVNQLAERVRGAAPQVKVSCILKTPAGWSVELYGYADYVLVNKCTDLKVTSAYDLGKYKDSCQRHLYPLALRQDDVLLDEFEFLVYDTKAGGVFSEPYPVNYDESYSELANVCDRLIAFVQAKGEKITDTKIYGTITGTA